MDGVFLKHVGLDYDFTPPAPTPPTPGKIYRVQVGAFAVKESADRFATELKTKGYNTIVV